MLSQSTSDMIKPTSAPLRRSEYIKIYLSASELKVLELKEKRVTKHYTTKGTFYNRPDYFRLFMLNLDSPDLISLLDSFYEMDKKNK